MDFYRKTRLSEAEQCILEVTATRLKNAVTPLQISNWLNNFDASDRALASELLSRFEFITEKEFNDIGNEALKTWVSAIKPQSTDHIFLNPIGDFGKSGTLLTYYLRKTPFFISLTKTYDIRFLASERVLWQTIKKKKFPPGSHLVFYDDFGGTGKTVVKYVKKFMEHLAKDQNIKSLSTLLLFALSKAKGVLSNELEITHVIQEERNKAFASRQSPFGNRARELREFAYSYGSNLQKYALGYQNSQALIAFPYGCPNNTLPIIWSDSKEWEPLFPRFPESRISAAKQIRTEQAFILSQFRELQDSRFVTGKKEMRWKTVQFITRTDFLVFGLVRLLRQQRKKPTTCHILGITSTDYDRLAEEAVKRGILDEQFNLTHKGMEEYSLLLSRLRYARRESGKIDLTTCNDEVYVPKTFGGES